MPKTSQRRLTKRSVDALASREKDYLVWDRDLPGFGVRVLVSGRKVFVVQARGPGGSKRRSIARHGRVPVAEARRQAAVAIDHIKQGTDPNPQAVPGEPTVAALAERYMRVHVAVSCKASSAQSYRGVIDNHIVPALGERKLGDVKRADVAALHYALRDTPGVANTTLQVLSQLFYKAEQWRLIGPRRSPCRSIPKYRLRARERYLTGEEYRRLGQVLKTGEADGSLAEAAVAALRLLMLTGCRREEILTLRWDDVDFAARELRLRDSKAGPRMVALTSAAKRVLCAIPRLPGNPWVIAGERPGRRLMTLKSTWRRVRRIAGFQGMRLHDLRHSYASRALAVGESLSMIGELLNHAQVQTTMRYAHLMRGAERAAAARVGDSIERHMDARGAASAQPGHSVREVR